MKIITHSQVQELVNQLPKAKLSLAYHLLQELNHKKATKLSSQADFMRYPINKRRQIMASQAEKLKVHYEQVIDERQEFQSGDFFDGY